MNTKELNTKDLTEYLTYLGYNHTRKSGNDYWYFSPFRDERTPSFKVNSKLNTWYDFGEGIGGTFIDFGIKYHNCSVGDLLKKFTFVSPRIKSMPTTPQKSQCKQSNNIQIIEVCNIKSLGLTSYLASRGISMKLADQYLREVKFKTRTGEFTALGFKNSSGGYELRNESFKGSSSPKDITFIEKNSDNLLMFEGFFDYLSFCVLRADVTQKSNALILNSTALLERSNELISRHKTTSLFFDNDPTGDKATFKILRNFPGNTSDGRDLFKSAKDLNEYLIKYFSEQKLLQKHILKRHPKT